MDDMTNTITSGGPEDPLLASRELDTKRATAAVGTAAADSANAAAEAAVEAAAVADAGAKGSASVCKSAPTKTAAHRRSG